MFHKKKQMNMKKENLNFQANHVADKIKKEQSLSKIILK
jgi:hypothetical protein